MNANVHTSKAELAFHFRMRRRLEDNDDTRQWRHQERCIDLHSFVGVIGLWHLGSDREEDSWHFIFAKKKPPTAIGDLTVGGLRVYLHPKF